MAKKRKSGRRGGFGGQGTMKLAKDFTVGAGTTAMLGNATLGAALNFFVLKTGVAGVAGAVAGGKVAEAVRPMTANLPDPVGNLLYA